PGVAHEKRTTGADAVRLSTSGSARCSEMCSPHSRQTARSHARIGTSVSKSQQPYSDSATYLSEVHPSLSKPNTSCTPATRNAWSQTPLLQPQSTTEAGLTSATTTGAMRAGEWV